MPSENRRKANNALGAVVICFVFFMETVTANHASPDPTSHAVWIGLGLAAAACLFLYFHYAGKDRDRHS